MGGAGLEAIGEGVGKKKEEEAKRDTKSALREAEKIKLCFIFCFFLAKSKMTKNKYLKSPWRRHRDATSATTSLLTARRGRVARTAQREGSQG